MNSETKIITIIGIITVAVIALGLYFAGGAGTPESTVKVIPANLIHPDSFRLTGTDPKLQIVEFGDFQCPACAAEAPNIAKLIAAYGKNIDYVFRIIPIHEHSKEGAAAAYAAGEQGKFFEMGNILFAKQDEWTATGAVPETFFSTYAASLGLDMAKFKADYKNNQAKYYASVDRDSADASSMGINSTPTLIFNGNQVATGALTYEHLQQIVEAAIAGNGGAPSKAAAAPSAQVTSTPPAGSNSLNMGFGAAAK